MPSFNRAAPSDTARTRMLLTLECIHPRDLQNRPQLRQRSVQRRLGCFRVIHAPDNWVCSEGPASAALQIPGHESSTQPRPGLSSWAEPSECGFPPARRRTETSPRKPPACFRQKRYSNAEPVSRRRRSPSFRRLVVPADRHRVLHPGPRSRPA